ncbi:MAG TPA: response regulator [Leptospiraceae bacterium]|nr:response regulator [Leptospiraceae bacterium]HMW03661.1 response regulator [Leptospiraceae bacterium]HMX31212.1 response regulator [Leptospiraceae bacterium]HMY29418.1 response regulator [Leptospiraceae bacterium]HNA06395.1 response regulator [Leptospiraceae bacterium]
MRNKIFIIDDSKSFSKLIALRIKNDLGLDSITASSFSEAKKVLEEERDSIFLALVDLNIADAKGTEHIDYMLEEKVPVIVITGELNDEIRNKILEKNIIDYIFKSKKEDMEYVIKLLRQIVRNSHTKVVVADDSPLFRKLTSDLLRLQMFQVLEAKNGLDCLNIVHDNPDIKLVLTDYNMKEMDGFELTLRLREKYPKESLIVISISGNDTKNISSKFIKIGANDFLTKPFTKEEFACRINMNLDALDSLEKIKDLSYRDFLTGLYNRKYFLEKGKSILTTDKNAGLALFIVDHFKKLNSDFGQEAGDLILNSLGIIAKEHFSKENLLFRLEGKKFGVILPNTTRDKALLLLDSFRDKVASIPINSNGNRVEYTISIGLSVSENQSFDTKLREAEEELSQARKNGRNQVSAKS